MIRTPKEGHIPEQSPPLSGRGSDLVPFLAFAGDRALAVAPTSLEMEQRLSLWAEGLLTCSGGGWTR